jgi:hypothetical protein
MGQLPQRLPVLLPDLLHRRLHAYGLAASAASLLALPQMAEGKIVYTPANQLIGPNGIYGLDLNLDGKLDFLILQWISNDNALLARAAYGNGVQGGNYGSALSHGAKIGGSQQFSPSGYFGRLMVSVGYNSETGKRFVRGPWENVDKRYLGLKFKIGKTTHYGWARLDVQVVDKSITATLTGYAYQTIAEKPILAGAKGLHARADQAGITRRRPPQPNLSLGNLALGAARAGGRP